MQVCTFAQALLSPRCLYTYPFMKLLASTRECEQHKRRSVCASEQSHQHPCCSLSRKHIGLVETKPCFGVPIKKRLIPVSPATETSYKNWNFTRSKFRYHSIYEATESKGADRAGLCLCCSKTPEDRFSHVETHIMPACYMKYFYI